MGSSQYIIDTRIFLSNHGPDSHANEYRTAIHRSRWYQERFGPSWQTDHLGFSAVRGVIGSVAKKIPTRLSFFPFCRHSRPFVMQLILVVCIDSLFLFYLRLCLASIIELPLDWWSTAPLIVSLWFFFLAFSADVSLNKPTIVELFAIAVLCQRLCHLAHGVL